MKTIGAVPLAAVLTLLWGVPGLTQGGHDLFQQALVKEQVDGDLRAAIVLYERIVQDFAGDRGLAAKTLVQLGRCHERLGGAEASAARKAYERVVREFADQTNVAAEARTRLAALTPVAGTPAAATMTVRLVWTGQGSRSGGGVSPDGRFVSFTDWDTGDLGIRDLATGLDRRLTNKGSWAESEEFAEASVPSPDSRQIAYNWYNSSGAYDLRIIGLDGSKPRVLKTARAGDFDVTPLAWSPDGKNLLTEFLKADGSRDMMLVAVADGSMRLLKGLGAKERSPGGAFSPDGRYLAWAVKDGLGLVDLQTGTEHPLVRDLTQPNVVGWAPGGKHLLFSSDRSGSNDIWLVAVAGAQAIGAPELVKKDYNGYAAGITRAGSFYYGVSRSVRDVHVAELDTERGRVVAPPQPVTTRWVGITRSPDWSPDGRFLAYVRDPAPSEPVIVIRSAAAGEERDLRVGKMRLGMVLRWAPDGKAVVVPAFESGKGWNLVRVDAQSGLMTVLMPLPLNGAFPRFALSPDGKTVFYVELPDAPNTVHIRLLARDLASGRVTEVVRKDLLNWISVSPDGQRLLIGAQEDRSLVWRVMPLTGGEGRVLVRVDPDEANYRVGASWTPDGRYVVFAKGQKGRATRNVQVWRVAAEGGKPQPLGLTVDELWWLSQHPDGRHVAFGTFKPSSDLWAMENFLPKAAAGLDVRIR